MPMLALTLVTGKVLEGVYISKKKLKTLVEDMEQGSGSLDFEDGNKREIVLAVQHIVSAEVLAEEDRE
ncbi:hypothetical protein [Deinococcus sp. UYEF24]